LHYVSEMEYRNREEKILLNKVITEFVVNILGFHVIKYALRIKNSGSSCVKQEVR